MAVTLANVANTLGRSTPSPSTTLGKQWSMWIEDARRIIKNRLGDLDALDQDDLDYVVREAVAEKVKHPDRVRKIDVAVDDASTSKTYDSSTGQIEILDDWWDMLTPNVTDPDAFTITPYAPRNRCR